MAQLRDAPDQSEFAGGWLVAQTKPQRERWAVQNLTSQGLETYLPLIAVHLRRGGIRRQSLFPRYIFVYSSQGQWRTIRSTYGISTLIMRGGIPAVIPAKEIQQIRAREDEDGLVRLPQSPSAANLRAGDAVRIVEGPFAGRLGICEGTPIQERVRILMEFLGGYIPCLLHTNQLDPL